VPGRIDVTPDEGGEHDERAVLERTIESDRLYVMDRGYAKFALFNKIVEANSSYVCRLLTFKDASINEDLALLSQIHSRLMHYRVRRTLTRILDFIFIRTGSDTLSALSVNSRNFD
jgi:hypothetical protein